MSQISGLTVRHHAREEFGLTVEFTIAPRDRDQVRFSKLSSARSTHVVRGIATDISSGGLGWRSRQYVPRMCEGNIRVFRPGVDPQDSAGPEDVIFEHEVRVRRVFMDGDDRTYAVGVAFIDPAEDVGTRIEAIKRVAAEAAQEGADA